MPTKNIKRPIIGITIGDAAGIGPEVVLKSLADKSLGASCEFVLIGDGAHLRRIASEHGVDLELIEIYDPANLPPSFEIGVDSAVTAACTCIDRSRLTRRGLHIQSE